MPATSLAPPTRDVLISGGTGYIGRPLAQALLARGHRVRVLARNASVGRVTEGATPIIGDALDAASVASALQPHATLVHLVGTPHPNPAKAASFIAVDLASIRASVTAARERRAAHLVYVSVAQPAPVMRAYIEARAGRSGDRAGGTDRDDPATVVRARSRPPLAAGPRAAREHRRDVARDARERVAPRFRDIDSDCRSAGERGGDATAHPGSDACSTFRRVAPA